MNGMLRRALTGSCVVFTLIVFLFYASASLILKNIVPAMTLPTVFAFYCTSLCVSFASCFILPSRMPRIAAYILHCVCCVGPALFIYTVVLSLGDTAAQRMIFIFIAVFIWAVSMLCRAAVLAVLRRKAEKD